MTCDITQTKEDAKYDTFKVPITDYAPSL